MAAIAIGVLVALLAGCASKAPVDTVVVLPDPDGRTGSVVVQRGDQRQVLDQPYAASRSGAQVTRLSAAEVRQSFGATLGALPARPTSFVLYFVTATDELTEGSRGELQKVLAALKLRGVPDVVAIDPTGASVQLYVHRN